MATNDKWENQTIHIVSCESGIVEKVFENCGRPFDWSLDKTKILYCDLGKRPLAISLLELNTGRKTVLLQHPKNNLLAARVSPDGHWISFTVSSRPGIRQVYVVPFRSVSLLLEQQWLAVTDDSWNGSGACWSPDGNLRSPFFGRSVAAYPARQVQLAVRFEF
jgi:Tol biopolymer transport system component